MKLRCNRIGGGVAIYCHKKVKCVPLSNYEIGHVEAVWAEVTIENERVIVGSAYIPPGAVQQLSDFVSVLKKVQMTMIVFC